MSDAIPNTSGIYKITCTVNKRIYIGSAVNLRDRKRQHFNELRQNKHYNHYLQRAWNKYGESVFTFEVLELVLSMSLTAREQYWLNKLKPFRQKGFNIARDTVSPNLGRKNTPEAIEKTRQAQLGRKQTPEHVEKVRQANIGKKMSLESREKIRQAQIGHHVKPETREKISQARLGKPGRKQAPESIEKIRQASTGRKHTPEARARMGQAQLGHTRNLGSKHTPERNEKNRRAHLGHEVSPATREKLRQIQLARPARERGADGKWV